MPLRHDIFRLFQPLICHSIFITCHTPPNASHGTRRRRSRAPATPARYFSLSAPACRQLDFADAAAFRRFLGHFARSHAAHAPTRQKQSGIFEADEAVATAGRAAAFAQAISLPARHDELPGDDYLDAAGHFASTFSEMQEAWLGRAPEAISSASTRQRPCLSARRHFARAPGRDFHQPPARRHRLMLLADAMPCLD